MYCFVSQASSRKRSHVKGGLFLILSQSSNGNLRVMPDLFAIWVCVASYLLGLRQLSEFLWFLRN